MVWAFGKNGSVSYGQKGVDEGSKWIAVRGRPRLGWMDGVKVELGNRGMMADNARKIRKSGKRW